MMRARRFARIVIAPLLSCACATLHPPAGPVTPDRPGFGDTPTVLPAAVVQLESGFTFDRVHDVTSQSAGESLLRVGVGSGIELRVFGNSYATVSGAGSPTVRGMQDSKIGVKIRLVEVPDSTHGILPSLAFLAATTVPTGARALGAGVAQAQAQLAAGWTTASPLEFGVNVGVSAAYDGAAWSNPGWASATASYELLPSFSFFAESMQQFDARGPVRPATVGDAGFTLMLGERLQIDARIGRGLGGDATGERFFGFGIARRF